MDTLFDIETLLRPLSPDQPCGVDLRLHAGGDTAYFQLKDLRATARAIERRADSDEEAQSAAAEWQRILRLGRDALIERTKDLEIAVWLTEAAVRLGGFAGLCLGFRLLAGLVEHHWDTVYPLPDEDGMAIRLAPIGGLNGLGAEGTLIQPIRKVPLAENDAAPGFAYWHYELARRAIQAPDARGRTDGKGMPSLDALRQRMEQIAVPEKRRLLDDIRACRSAFHELDRLLTERCGAEAPPTSTITHILEEIEDAVIFLTGLREVAAPAVESIEAEPVATVAEPEIQLPRKGIASREEALRLLDEIGQYFRRTEPHSPLSYTIEDLVRRGRMSLPELLAELLQDSAARHNLLTAAGIRSTPQQSP
ncbi:MAG TPA: type VI secretion system protein TssA [Stellaceae bacterium]|nr:type VI secretion system protein TssA [Stellaceae bacterium]